MRAILSGRVTNMRQLILQLYTAPNDWPHSPMVSRSGVMLWVVSSIRGYIITFFISFFSHLLRFLSHFSLYYCSCSIQQSSCYTGKTAQFELPQKPMKLDKTD